MALMAGSPAIDTADPRCDRNTDQRGVARPQGPRCDIGAFEVMVHVQSPAPTTVPSPPVTGIAGSGGAPAGGLVVVLSLLALAAAGAAGLVAWRRRSA